MKISLEVASRVDVPLLFFLYSLAGKLFLRFRYICSCRLSSVESTKFLAVISNVVDELVNPKAIMSKDTEILKPMLLSSKTIVSLLLSSQSPFVLHNNLTRNSSELPQFLPGESKERERISAQKLLILNNLECRLMLELRLFKFNCDDMMLSNYAEILSYRPSAAAPAAPPAFAAPWSA